METERESPWALGNDVENLTRGAYAHILPDVQTEFTQNHFA